MNKFNDDNREARYYVDHLYNSGLLDNFIDYYNQGLFESASIEYLKIYDCLIAYHGKDFNINYDYFPKAYPLNTETIINKSFITHMLISQCNFWLTAGDQMKTWFPIKNNTNNNLA